MYLSAKKITQIMIRVNAPQIRMRRKTGPDIRINKADVENYIRGKTVKKLPLIIQPNHNHFVR